LLGTLALAPVLAGVRIDDDADAGHG